MSLWYLIRVEEKEDENGKAISKDWNFCGIHFKPERAVEVAKKYIATVPRENAKIEVTKYNDVWFVDYRSENKTYITYSIIKTELEEEKDNLITANYKQYPIVWN